MVNPWRVGYFKRVIIENKLQPSGMSLLEVGCGGGLLSEELSALGFSVTGIDSSKDSIATARQHARRVTPRIDYEVASAEALPFKESVFDAVACTVAVAPCAPDRPHKTCHPLVRKMAVVLVKTQPRTGIHLPSLGRLSDEATAIARDDFG